MTGDAPWMGVTPQPPSESEPRVVRVTGFVGANWDEDKARAMLKQMLWGLHQELGADPKTHGLRIDLSVEVPWPDQSESR